MKKFLAKNWFYFVLTIGIVVIGALLISLIPKDHEFEITKLSPVSVDIHSTAQIEYSTSIAEALCTFEVENDSIATVEDNTVVGHAVGTTNLIMTAKYGEQVLTERTTIHVDLGLEVELDDIVVVLGESHELTPTIKLNGSICLDAQVGYQSQNKEIATVENGYVVAKGVGKTKLEVTVSVNGRVCAKNVNVEVKEDDTQLFSAFLDSQTLGSSVEIEAQRVYILNVNFDGSVTIETNLNATKLGGGYVNTWKVTADEVGIFYITICADNNQRTITITAI